MTAKMAKLRCPFSIGRMIVLNVWLIVPLILPFEEMFGHKSTRRVARQGIGRDQALAAALRALEKDHAGKVLSLPRSELIQQLPAALVVIT
jgi:hypothetical protein